MRVLITGAAGFIGSHAARYFARKYPAWDLLTLDRLNYAAALNRMEEVRGRIKVVLHDLRAPLTDYVVAQLGPLDYILHFAAETHVDRSMVDPHPFIESNILGTYNLLEYARLHQPALKMFFMVSTDESYGAASPGVDHNESSPHRPSNPYSASKAAAEDLAYAWEHSMGVPTIITNTMNNIGEMQHPEKFVPKIIRSLYTQQIIPVHGSPDEPGSRKYLYAGDHADAIDFLMKDGRRGGRYNVVGAEEISNLEMVRRLEKVTGREAKIKFVDFHSTRPGHDRRYSLDGSKMAAMGWTPPSPIDDVLRVMCGFYVAREDWR
jgi:dTDP-glucose 4,6-dehydratase